MKTHARRVDGSHVMSGSLALPVAARMKGVLCKEGILHLPNGALTSGIGDALPRKTDTFERDFSDAVEDYTLAKQNDLLRSLNLRRR